MKFILVIMLCFLLSQLISVRFEFSLGPAISGVIRVPEDCPTISMAIDAAKPGDTILVDNGTYHERLNVHKWLRLIGEDPRTTIIDGDNLDIVVTLNAVVELCNFTIRNGGGSSAYAGGVFLNHSKCFIHDNIIINNRIYGIRASDSSFSNISDNLIANNTRSGILLGGWLGSESNVLDNNLVANNTRHGIWISSSTNTKLRNNSLNGNRYNFAIYGRDLAEYVQDIDTSNTVNGKPIYYWINQSHLGIPKDAGCVVVVNSSNIAVKNLNIMKNYFGILLAYSTNCVVENITAFNNEFSVTLDHSNNNIIQTNTICDSLPNDHIGIYLSYSNNNKIQGNTVINTTSRGVLMEDSDNNELNNNSFYVVGAVESLYSQNNLIGKGNTMVKCGVGVRLESATNTTVFGNIMEDCGVGVEMDWSDCNIVKDNTISRNIYGGILFLTYSPNNTFYHNNLIDNVVQVEWAFNSANNKWDNNFEGNYWSDYNGTDVAQDGIGDSPYTIDISDIDHYPLMNPAPTRHIAFAPPFLSLIAKQSGWLTCHIELLNEHQIEEINISSITLEGEVPIDLAAGMSIGDYDNDGIPDLTVKFNKTLVQNYLNLILPPIQNRFFQVTTIKLTITGKLHDNTTFQGTNTIKIIQSRTKPPYPLQRFPL